MNHYTLILDDAEVEDIDSLPDMDKLTIFEQAEQYPPLGWQTVFASCTLALKQISNALSKRGRFYPCPSKYLFHIFRICPLSKVKVVILGQDPYPNAKNAYGIAFSTPPEVSKTASLRTIYKELEEEYEDFNAPSHGCLLPWVDQGVFLLNYCLTYHPDDKLKPEDLDVWMSFVSKVIDAICLTNPNTIFVLWGRKAEAVKPRIKGCESLIGVHPSSRAQGFIGCNHFRQINEHLIKTGQTPVDWRL